MTHRITEPGVYGAIPADVYHADPCPTASLSAGMINLLLLAPAKCWEASPRLNPDAQREDDDDGRFTIGTVAHVIFLEPELFHARVLVVDAPDWRSNAAKAQRAQARAEGRVAILAKHLARVLAAREAFGRNAFVREAFERGAFEQSMFWRHTWMDIWCRARADFIAADGGHLCDYKTTGNADPTDFGRHAFGMGYHRRAAWYLDGADALLGSNPERRYWFVNQEIRPPYLTSVVELDDAAIEAGRVENARAAHLFEGCLRTGEWPGYRHPHAPDRDLAFRVGLPPWGLQRIDERVAL